jgi:hypothetical protein
MTGPFRPPPGGPAGFPGQGGQEQPHPTVGNFGMPGGPVTIERPSGQPPAAPQGGSWQMPPAPQQQQQTFPQQQQQQQQQPPVQGYGQPAPPQGQPHPTVGFGQPAPQGQQQQQQQQPQGQQQGGQRSDIPDNLILDGAGVPPELRGRSWGQVKQIYGALANDFLLRQNGGQRQQQQQPAPQGRQQQQPPVYVQGQPNGGQPPQGQRESSFWENPEETIARIVDSRLAPVTQRTTAMAIQEARQVARSGIPDFDYLEAEMIGIMAGADPNALADPRLWQSTAELARGRLMGRGQYDPRSAQRQPQNGQQQQPMNDPRQMRGPGGYVPAPVAPVGQFFTEAPTPPQGGQQFGYDYGQNGQLQITGEEQGYARKMNMTDAEYVAWRGGVIQTAPARRY